MRGNRLPARTYDTLRRAVFSLSSLGSRSLFDGHSFCGPAIGEDGDEFE